MSRFARRLLAEWRSLALPSEAGGRVVLAVSGGADSTALLLACEELRRTRGLPVEILAAHLDHGLRGERSAADARWIEELARASGLQFTSERASGLDSLSKQEGGAWGGNLEQAARRARYEFLARAAGSFGASAVLTGHTLDDQAETVLLRLLRGSGAAGLGGMRPARRLERGGELMLVRPLLRWARRADTEEYCRARGVEARLDEMNLDERYARVRLRRKVLPLLETFNPRVVEALARTAELLRDDASALDASAEELLSRATTDEASASPSETEAGKSPSGTEAVESSLRTSGGLAEGDAGASSSMRLRVSVLREASVSVRRRALRLWVGRGRGDLRRVEMAHLSALEKLVEGERGGRVAELPGGCRVWRWRGWLCFERGAGGEKS